MKKVHHKLNLKQMKRPLKSSKKEHLVKLKLRFWKNKGWINKTDPYGWF